MSEADARRGSEAEEDAPDIPPALSDRDWQRRGTGIATSTVHRQIDPVMIRREHDVLIISGRGDGNEIEIRDADHLAALIALANDTLRQFDDPRALIREHVTLLRELAERLGEESISTVERPEGRIGVTVDDLRPDLDRFGMIHELADAIESYLPPLTPEEISEREMLTKARKLMDEFEIDMHDALVLLQASGAYLDIAVNAYRDVEKMPKSERLSSAIPIAQRKAVEYRDLARR